MRRMDDEKLTAFRVQIYNGLRNHSMNIRGDCWDSSFVCFTTDGVGQQQTIAALLFHP